MWSEGSGTWWQSRWPVALAIALRLAVWFTVPGSRFESDEGSYYQAGMALLSTGTQDLFWPPLTGWLIAAAAWVLHTVSVPAIRLVWIAMDIACVGAIATLARRAASAVTDDPERAGRIVMVATVGYAIYLPAVSFSQFTTSEVPALLQLLAILVLLTRPGVGLWGVGTAGVLTGTLILTRPSLIPLLVLLPLWVSLRGPWRDRLERAALMLMAGGLVVGAIVGRNWWTAGEPTIARNSAYNLYVGNRDLYAEDLDLFSPRATEAQVEFRRQFWNGTLQYPSEPADQLQRAALAWIAGHPVQFGRRAIGRLARVFAPRTDVLELVGGERAAGLFSPLALALLLVANLQWTWILFAGIVGILTLKRRDPALGGLYGASICGGLLLCVVAIAKPRYSFVFDPLLLVGAAIVTAAPGAALARLTTIDRWLLAAASAFLLWGWAAWLIFAVTSRLALGAQS